MKGALGAIAAAVLATSVVGCIGGGGLGGPFDFTFGPIVFPGVSGVSISGRQTVQAGTTATIVASPFSLSSTPQHYVYVWCRAAAGGGNCVTMPGEVGATLTIANASLSDDGATFRVTVTSTNDQSSQSASTQLFVSSMPGVVFQDGDFVDANWTATSTIAPPVLASTYSVTRVADGGRTGAYRKVLYDVLPTGDVRVFHERASAAYDPRSEGGAVRSIDFSIDCLLLTRSEEAITTLLLEQNGRRYTVSGSFGDCAGSANPFTPTWHTQTGASLAPEDFKLVDGPACGANEACPDFSDTASPLRFGFVTHAAPGGVAVPGGGTPVHFEHGLDNWKVTVWRR